MIEYFQKWGNFYEVIVAIIFGIISVILWIQDRKKSTLIKELQRQTKISQTQLEILQTQDRPYLKVIKKDYQVGVGLLALKIENIGSDLFNLAFNNNKSEQGFFEIIAQKYSENISRKNTFEIKINHILKKDELVNDFLRFKFNDKLGIIYEQILYLSSREENILFHPVLRN